MAIFEEIAKHLGVSKETIYRWAEKSKIPAHKVGRQWSLGRVKWMSGVCVGNAAKLKVNTDDI